jgi:protein-S-isoprenylcysteine O-methyltransferase Ste14
VIFVLARAFVYATGFIGVLLVFLPAQIVSRSGIALPAARGVTQIAGLVLAATGGVLAVSCILTFVFIGRGTPAPFDPPRRLVDRGPYRWVRNPMYIGAGTALFGAALYYQSLWLTTYGVGFLAVMHLFIVFYEEPALRSTFGRDYEEYCRRVRRWRPQKP